MSSTVNRAEADGTEHVRSAIPAPIGPVLECAALYFGASETCRVPI